MSLDDLYNSALNASGSVSLLKDFNKLTARTTARVLIEKQTEQSATASGTNFAVSGVPRLDAALSRNSSSSSEDGQGAGLLLHRRHRLRQPHHSRRRSFVATPARCSGQASSGTPTIARVRRTAWRRNRGGRGKRVNEFKLRGSQGTAGTRPDFADQYETYTISSNGTLAKSVLGNRFLKPETAKETEFGLDVIFDNRYSLQLSRVDERTTDELVADPASRRRRLHVAVAERRNGRRQQPRGNARSADHSQRGRRRGGSA